jgi:outer membrane protein assembly factor BamB
VVDLLTSRAALRRRAPIAIIAALAVAAMRASDEWPRFRGPNGSGVSTTANLPAVFGPDTNVVWKTTLPFGHSSPVLTEDRIYVTAARDGRLLTIALERASGRLLWEREAPRARTEKLDNRNGPAAPSAATDGRDVYVFFADFGLISYDREGRERWRVPLGPFNNVYGMGASPILAGDLVVLVCDQSTQSYIAAFAMRDGALRWKTARAEARSGHSTPILYTAADGEEQILVPGSLQVAAYAARTGEKIWWVNGLPWEMKSTPVLAGSVLYIHGFGAPENQPGQQRAIPAYDAARVAYDANTDGILRHAELPPEHSRAWIDLDGDGAVTAEEWGFYRAAMASENGALAIKAGGRGDMTATNVLWRYHKAVPQLPSPLLYRNVLYMVNDGGIVTTLRPDTGEAIAQGRLEGAIDRFYASPVAADGKVFMASEKGKVVVLPTDGSLRPVAVNDLGDDIYATPAIADGRIYLRTRNTLYCFAQGAQAGG